MPHALNLNRMFTALVVVTVSGCAASLKPRSAECTVATVFAGAGCAPLPRASDASDVEGKQFSPVKGKANVYVVRPSIVGGRNLWNIEIDGKPVGPIAEHTYLLIDIEPGSHEVTAVTGENRHSVVVNAPVGENLILEVVSKIGWTESRAELRMLSLEQGQAAVRSAKRAQSMQGLHFHERPL